MVLDSGNGVVLVVASFLCGQGEKFGITDVIHLTSTFRFFFRRQLIFHRHNCTMTTLRTMMMRPSFLFLWSAIVGILCPFSSLAFSSSLPASSSTRNHVALVAAASDPTSSTSSISISLTPAEQGVYEFFKKLHQSQHAFRIVVVGGAGGILETTSPLGPVFKTSQSPKSGKVLLTMATEDQSFEFHVTLSQVAQLAIVERPSPDGARTIRVIRVLTDQGASVCSLILGDDSDDAAAFFETLQQEYGPSYEFAKAEK